MAGYKFNKEGKCEINYSFKAIYQSFVDSQDIDLFKSDDSIELIEMSVDGQYIILLKKKIIIQLLY